MRVGGDCPKRRDARTHTVLQHERPCCTCRLGMAAPEACLLLGCGYLLGSFGDAGGSRGRGAQTRVCSDALAPARGAAPCLSMPHGIIGQRNWKHWRSECEFLMSGSHPPIVIGRSTARSPVPSLDAIMRNVSVESCRVYRPGRLLCPAYVLGSPLHRGRAAPYTCTWG